MCWISNAESNDPLVKAKRRTVWEMKEKTRLPFLILSNQSREKSRMWAKTELKKISAKALRPSTWDSSFGDSPWGEFVTVYSYWGGEYQYLTNIGYTIYRNLRRYAPRALASVRFGAA